MKRHPNRILKRKKKGALELSMNTIIIVVIGVIILTLGLRWVYGIFQNLTGTTEDIDESLKKEIDRLFEGSDEPLVIRPNDISIGQGDTKKIAIGIKNLANDGRAHNYNYKIELTNPEGKDVNQVMSWVIGSTGQNNLNSGQSVTELVPISLPRNAPLGIYRFSVILTSDDPGGNTKAQFIVRIVG